MSINVKKTKRLICHLIDNLFFIFTDENNGLQSTFEIEFISVKELTDNEKILLTTQALTIIAHCISFTSLP